MRARYGGPIGPPPAGHAVAPGTAAGFGGGQEVPSVAPLAAAGGGAPGAAHSDVAGGGGPSAGGTGAGSAVAWPPAKAPEPGAAALRAE